MGCGEIEDLELASMDLYTGVKLKTSRAKSCYRNTNGHLVPTARFRKSSPFGPGGENPTQIPAIPVGESENQRVDDALSIKHDGLMWLLEIMKEDLRNRIMETRNRNKTGKRRIKNIKNFIWEKISAEEIAVEMLKALSEGHGFEFGELVWGKIKSHPWWPGQIYDEALSCLSACFGKEEGRVLVAFFGDYTYAWLDPKYILPFKRHFDEKSKLSQDRVFLNAVNEAMLEVKRRSALGLSCKCLTHCAFTPSEVEGFLKVDVEGYGGGSVYSVEQIKKARNSFEPREMFYFLENLAVKPNVGSQNDVDWMRNVGSVIAYRKAVSQEIDDMYAEAFEVTSVDNEHGDGISYVKENDHQARLVLESKGSARRSKLSNSSKNDNRTIKKQGVSDCQKEKIKITKRRQKKMKVVDDQKYPTKGTTSLIEDDTKQTMLVIKFPPQSRMPSVSELKAKFARFGPLIESSVRVFWKSSTCQVVFVCQHKAQAAYDHALKNSALFGESQVSYYLQPLGDSSTGITDSRGFHEKLPK